MSSSVGLQYPVSVLSLVTASMFAVVTVYTVFGLLAAMAAPGSCLSVVAKDSSSVSRVFMCGYRAQGCGMGR